MSAGIGGGRKEEEGDEKGDEEGGVSTQKDSLRNLEMRKDELWKQC
jgi:hypothetical protein